MLLLSSQWYIHLHIHCCCCLLAGSILHSPTLSNHSSSPGSPLESERSRSTSSPPHHSPQAHSGETAWKWYDEKVGRGRCHVVDAWWQTGEYISCVKALSHFTSIATTLHSEKKKNYDKALYMVTST